MAIGGFFLVALLWTIGVMGVVAGGILLSRRRRGWGWSLLIAGLVVVLSPLSYLAYALSPLNWPTTMHVEGLDPPNDPWFTVELRHTRDFEDGTEYHFGNAGSPEHIAAVFQEQHPDGVVTTGNPTPTAQGGESIWHLSTDDVRYELVQVSDAPWYELATQLVVVQPTGDGPKVRIPFPRSAFNATTISEGQTYANGWSEKQWADFYADITKVHVDGDSITVPTNRGTTATITIDEGLATVTIDD